MRGIKGLAGWRAGGLALAAHCESWPDDRLVRILIYKTPLQDRGSPHHCGWRFDHLSLPQHPGKPLTIFGYRYFSERESQVLLRRVSLDDSSKAGPRKTVSWAELKKTLRPTPPSNALLGKV